MLSGLHQGCPVSGQRRHPHGAGDGGGGAAGAGAAGRGHRQCDDRVPLAAAHSLPPAHARHRPRRQPQVREAKTQQSKPGRR